MTIDYTVPDSTTITAALAAADRLRSESDPDIALLIGHIDALVQQLRDVTHAHAESIDAYHAMRQRVRDAVEQDDYQ